MIDIKPPEEEKPVNLFYQQLEKESQISEKPNPDMYLDKFQEVAHELCNIIEHSLDDEREQVLIRTSFLKEIDWLLSVGHRAYMNKPDKNLHEISETLKEILREMRKKRIMNGIEWSIEKQWKYKDYECLITYTSNSCIEDYRCGYVVLGDDYYVDTENISCHGGVTCYGWHARLGKSVVGFDCSHYGDSLEICTLDYCIQQCESIVEQLLTLNRREDKK